MPDILAVLKLKGKGLGLESDFTTTKGKISVQIDSFWLEDFPIEVIITSICLIQRHERETFVLIAFYLLFSNHSGSLHSNCVTITPSLNVLWMLLFWKNHAVVKILSTILFEIRVNHRFHRNHKNWKKFCYLRNWGRHFWVDNFAHIISYAYDIPIDS